MLFNKSKPFEYPIAVNPGQVMVVEFRSKGRIKVDLYVHYLMDRRGKSTNVVNSGVVIVGEDNGADRVHTVKMIAPQFNVTNAIKSVIYFTTDSYKDILIDDLIIDNEGAFEERKRRILSGEGGAVGLGPGGVPKFLETSGVAGLDITASNLIIGYDKVFEALAKSGRILPVDSINRIFYMRPWANDSFGLVGWFHIHHMRWNMDEREKEAKLDSLLNTSQELPKLHKASQMLPFEIVDIAYDALKDPGWMNWTEKRNILLHPFLYPFATAYKLNETIKTFGSLLGMKNKIGGFDVSDSDKISSIAVLMINKLNLIMVPSSWCRDAFIGSGVRSEIVQVLPHGISNEFISVGLGEGLDTGNGEINMLRELKKGGNILVLFFCVHSEWRKGADLVAEVMRRIQRKGGIMSKVLLVVKSECDLGREYPGVRAVKVGGWLDGNDLRRLYDTCDILISPSRGGGFELNALEGASRGLVTLVTGGGCFTDLMQYYIPIEVGKNVQPLPGNPVHIGFGPEVDLGDFERKLEDAIVRLDELRGVFRDRSKEIRERYTWKNTALKLEEYLKRYEFIK